MGQVQQRHARPEAPAGVKEAADPRDGQGRQAPIRGKGLGIEHPGYSGGTEGLGEYLRLTVLVTRMQVVVAQAQQTSSPAPPQEVSGPSGQVGPVEALGHLDRHEVEALTADLLNTDTGLELRVEVNPVDAHDGRELRWCLHQPVAGYYLR